MVSVGDTYFIGRLGTAPLAGLALVFPLIMLLQMTSAGAMGGGVSSAIARALGAGHADRARRLVVHALVIAAGMAGAFTILILLLGPGIYGLLGGRDETLDHAVRYSNIVFAGAITVWMANTLSSVLRGILAQRLIRRICENCAVESYLNPDQIAALGLKVPVERRDSLRVRSGEGCVSCRYTGLFGRTGVFEMLDVGRRIRALINDGKDANEIHHAGRIEGMEPLRDAAVRKLADGVTTFEEIIRVTADSE